MGYAAGQSTQAGWIAVPGAPQAVAYPQAVDPSMMAAAAAQQGGVIMPAPVVEGFVEGFAPVGGFSGGPHRFSARTGR